MRREPKCRYPVGEGAKRVRAGLSGTSFVLLLLLRTERGSWERDATDELALHWKQTHDGGFVNPLGRSFIILL